MFSNGAHEGTNSKARLVVKLAGNIFGVKVVFLMDENQKSIGMKKKKAKAETSKADRNKLYDLTTPLWHKYYQRVRSTVRFPRYYKDALNW